MKKMKVKMMEMLLLFVIMVAFAPSATAQTNPGFLSIDCGAPNNYVDTTLNISYKTDAEFISTGENMQVSTDVINNANQLQSKNMRIFPNGTRNCYKLSPEQGKEHTYLIRAAFWYANYDGKNQAPSFDLYIDVNYWATVNSDKYVYEEIVYVPPRDDIQLCLVRTGSGVPFISSIELRLLDDSTYEVDSGALVVNWRYDIGGTEGTSIRYPYDVYDRLWSAQNYDSWNNTATNSTIDGFATNNDEYKLPESVLTTAARSLNSSYSLILSWEPISPTRKWYMFFHFAEFEVLQTNQTREFGVNVQDKLISTVGPEFGKPVTVASFPVTSETKINFTLRPTEASNLPAILNALEVMYGVDLTNKMTDLNDVQAMNDIKTTYHVIKDSWQGDPCSPRNFSWDGLNCSYDTMRIISLNLKSSNLVGKIATSISNLTALTSLDLSYNQLTGEIPDFLGNLPSLSLLNLTGNNFSGSIPESLKKKLTAGTLKASFDANLCQSGSCATSSGKKKNSVVVPVVAALVSVVVLIVLLVFAVLWRKKRKQRGSTAKASTRYNDGQVGVARSQMAFTSTDIAKFTNNYDTVIGEGGYGKVYLGSLYDGKKVAVKMPTKPSSQGYKEFQAEAELLMVVHHRNLVSLVGYCDEVRSMALIYEFMSGGNLRQHLSEHNPNVLSWSQRVQIAIDAAQGLEYLHNGCKPPIIHRDLKTPNILINESMQAKIADFGLSKAFASDIDSHISTRPAGTPGYLDPEFHASGNLTKKSDVYSFGIILFELITGHPAIIRSQQGSMHIVAWVTPHIENGDIQSIVDPRLNGRFTISSAWKAVEIAMSCVPTSSHQRPDINRVLSDLKECLGTEIGSINGQGINGGSRNWRSSSFEMSSVEIDVAPLAR